MDEAEESTNKCADSLDEFGNEVEGSKKGINALAAVLAAAGIAKTVKEIADVLLECAEAAAGFETAMAKVSTLADTTKVPLESLKAQFLELSSETGVAVGALAEAAYQALSAGVDTANVVDFVSTATKTSAAGFTEASTAVNVLTTAINAYKMEGTEAERVASMLMKTQDEGKTSVGELAQNMGRVIPVASAYKVNLENITTAYAILTKDSANTAISTTNLAAMLDELGKKGSNVAGILEEQTGKSFAELMGSGSNLYRRCGKYALLIRETVKEVLDEENPVYKDLKDVPECWQPTAAALLEAGAVNGGTPAEVCATDLNLRKETLRAVVVAAAYHDTRERAR